MPRLLVKDTDALHLVEDRVMGGIDRVAAVHITGHQEASLAPAGRGNGPYGLSIKDRSSRAYNSLAQHLGLVCRGVAAQHGGLVDVVGVVRAA